MPNPSSSHDYFAYLDSPEWAITRAHALYRAHMRCESCARPAAHVRLEVHHLTYRNLGHESPEDLMVLCRECHGLEHGWNRR